MKKYDNLPNPSFVIEEEKIRRNIKIFKYIKSKTNVNFLMALKGFANYKAFSFFQDIVEGASASSLSEAKLAKEHLTDKIHLYAPVYNEDELKEMVRFSSHITFNSFNQYERFIDLTKKLNPNISVGIRVNPGYSDVEKAIYNPSDPKSRLGVPVDKMPKVLPDDIEGIHFHTLCESDDKALFNLIKIFTEKFERYLYQIKWVNIGGGHLVTHETYNVDNFIKIINDFERQYAHLDIYVEPSAAYVWQAGVLVARVEDIVTNGGIFTAILNVSFTAHMPDTLEMPYKPKVINEKCNGKFVYRFGGNSCLAGDYIDGFKFDTKLNVGDLIVFCDMIHYTTVKTTFFNGIKHPSIGLLRSDGKFEVFRKFGYESYKNKL